MATIPQIRTRLFEGFPEKQADLLAHVVIESHDDLVNQADFHALTGVVRDLADAQRDLAKAQKQTEKRVEELTDLMRADVIAVAKRAEEIVHIVVEVSCTADADDLARAVRRAAALASAGHTAIGIVACESISPQTLAAARNHGLRVLTNGWLLPEAA
jgi:hypothetical protein